MMDAEYESGAQGEMAEQLGALAQELEAVAKKISQMSKSEELAKEIFSMLKLDGDNDWVCRSTVPEKRGCRCCKRSFV